MRRSRRTRFDAVAQALVHVGLAVLLAVGAVLLLGSDRSTRVLVATAALAGGAGALLSTASSASSSWSSASRTAAYSSLMFAALGVTTGGGGFLLAAALLVGDLDTRLSSTGAAGFGLLVGALAGQMFLLVVRQTTNAGTSHAGKPTGLSSAFAYLDEAVQDRIFGPRLIDYDGEIFAAWKPQAESGFRPTAEPVPGTQPRETLVLGRMRLIFVSVETKDVDPRTRLEGSPGSKASDLVTTHAMVRVRAGTSADSVPFTLAIRGYGGEAYPARVDVSVPANGVSEVIEFTLVRPAPFSTTDAGQMAAPSTSIPPAILIDIAQAGTTIQILEVMLDQPSSPSGPEHPRT